MPVFGSERKASDGSRDVPSGIIRLLVTVTPPTVNEVAVITPTLRFDGGEILVENPARPDALDILCYFLVIYEDSIAVNIVLNVVELVNAG